jgi:hypothetical protein
VLQKLVGLSVVGVVLAVTAHADLTPHNPHFGDGIGQLAIGMADGSRASGFPVIRSAVVEPFGSDVEDLRGVGSPVVALVRLVHMDVSSSAGLSGTPIQRVLPDEYGGAGRTYEWTYFGAAGTDDRLSRFGPSFGDGDEWEALGSGWWSSTVTWDDDWHCEVESKSVSPVPAPAAAALGAIGIGLVVRAKRRLL